ncbi:TcpQ domain-containing protein [Alteromonas sp. 1_MG-2023]|uniref:TcpQ domain-containing protein n=1 Tax=Alteromonas sp. 1_MG-2023 TaxID=3062669 RepID=UPI0026E2F292|nr:TcpQ domain-containing protein [Alteromonas sp. 1_MG-2023]MDO6566351.1 TcpQ domain-containing protein [Alteromonas sp. 1_MG-2023]
MAKKGYSNTLFWARHIALALVLIVIAGFMIYLQQNNSDSAPAGNPMEEKSVAKGLSEFYREFRMSSTDPVKEEQGAFVLETGGVDPQLDNRLESMSSLTSSVDTRWTGEQKFRTFTEGSTLRESISDFAQAEGMQLIWNLDQDFVVKYQFQLDSTVAGSLAKIASAIDSSFEGEVRAYLCPEQRSLVVTAQETEFLATRCNLVR